jgi:2-polyprenyl-3-methyl-5-hydroxy-6-metoxy-1,4-benzoquinol methylase
MSDYYLEYMTDQERFPRAGFNRSKRLFVEQTIRGQLPAGARVLDVGCGSGWVSHNLVGDYDLIGVDIEEDAVTLCRSLYQAEYMVGTAFDLPFPDDHFDAVIFTEAIEHFETPAPALAEIARVLKPGGMALVTTPNCGSLFWVLIENTWHRFFGGPCKPYRRDVHPSRFTRESLREMLAERLVVESVNAVWFGLILTAVGRKRDGK